MGHKGSYSGGSGAIGNDIRDGLDDWLDSLPGATGATDVGPNDNAQQPPPTISRPSPSSPASRMLPTAALFRSSRTGGASRSAARPPRSLGLLLPRHARQVAAPQPPTRTAPAMRRPSGASVSTTTHCARTQTSSMSLTRSHRRSAKTSLMERSRLQSNYRL